jgi:hypothetical protein
MLKNKAILSPSFQRTNANLRVLGCACSGTAFFHPLCSKPMRVEQSYPSVCLSAMSSLTRLSVLKKLSYGNKRRTKDRPQPRL